MSGGPISQASERQIKENGTGKKKGKKNGAFMGSSKEIIRKK